MQNRNKVKGKKLNKFISNEEKNQTKVIYKYKKNKKRNQLPKNKTV